MIWLILFFILAASNFISSYVGGQGYSKVKAFFTAMLYQLLLMIMLWLTVWYLDPDLAPSFSDQGRLLEYSIASVISAITFGVKASFLPKSKNIEDSLF